MKATILAICSILAISAAACSSSDSAPATKADAATDAKTETAVDTGTATDSVVVVDSGGSPDDLCLEEASGQECINCCAMNHMDGYNTYAATAKECACKPTTCATECGPTFCATPQKAADAACSTCLKGTAATMECGTALGAACGSGDCKAFYDCGSKCPM